MQKKGLFCVGWSLYRILVNAYSLMSCELMPLGERLRILKCPEPLFVGKFLIDGPCYGFQGVRFFDYAAHAKL